MQQSPEKESRILEMTKHRRADAGCLRYCSPWRMRIPWISRAGSNAMDVQHCTIRRLEMARRRLITRSCANRSYPKSRVPYQPSLFISLVSSTSPPSIQPYLPPANSPSTSPTSRPTPIPSLIREERIPPAKTALLLVPALIPTPGSFTNLSLSASSCSNAHFE